MLRIMNIKVAHYEEFNIMPCLFESKEERDTGINKEKWAGRRDLWNLYGMAAF